MRAKYGKKHRGVSPVIATILMVAIAVVLSATVYIMANQINTQTKLQVLGSLVISKFSEHNITFTVTLERPRMPSISDIKVKVIDENGKIVSPSNYTWGITHITTDPSASYIKTGDVLYVQSDTVRFESGYQVIMIISGYDGVIEGSVP